jgi:hypothetical protein
MQPLRALARLLGVVGDRTTKEVGRSYFIRVATYDIVDGHVVIYDPNHARVVTLDPWPESLFAAADGQRTVDEFVAKVRSEWGPGVPANLAWQAVTQLLRLAKEGLVTLTDKPQELPPYLASPKSTQDPEEMEKQMIADGFIRKA